MFLAENHWFGMKIMWQGLSSGVNKCDLQETALGTQQVALSRHSEAQGGFGYLGRLTGTASSAGARPCEAPKARWAPSLLVPLVLWPVAMHVVSAFWASVPDPGLFPQDVWIDVL